MLLPRTLLRTICKLQSWILFLIFLVVFYNELLVYYFNKLNWPSNTCGEVKNVYKVLFVADPQILGENGESWVARWDSDRFLEKTFLMAYWHVNPSLVIFLGDLMDEGSVATNPQYDRYYSRFQKIFHVNSLLKNKTIYIPGDNDLGGENEDITALKVERFNKYFGLQPQIVNHGNILFLKVNLLLRIFPEIILKPDDKRLRIAISHLPLLGIPSVTSEQAVIRLQPHLIVSAHDHKSVHFVGDLKTGERKQIEVLIENTHSKTPSPKWRFQPGNRYTNEILVPTCSYRMGTEAIAYGVGLIDKKGEAICYNLLWLPSRLVSLKVYLYTVAPLLFVLFGITFLRIYRNMFDSSHRSLLWH